MFDYKLQVQCKLDIPLKWNTDEVAAKTWIWLLMTNRLLHVRQMFARMHGYQVSEIKYYFCSRLGDCQ